MQQQYATGKLPPNAAIQGTGAEEYLILSLLAKGGMGAVYRALRTGDHTIWAVKEMSASVIAEGEQKQTIRAFREEAQLLQTLAHENLPKVIDFFEYNHRQYMVMDFIEGHTLTELLLQNGGQMPEDLVVEWGKQLCLVLDYLHCHNPPIIYRDLKPDNVMVESATNRIKLIDFGIARRYKSGKRSDTVHLGTIGYAAPEQFGKSNRQSDAQTDLYALGATLHHLLTGVDPSQHPFQFADVREHVPVSDAVAEAIARAVERRVGRRHTSSIAMYKALSGEEAPVQSQSGAKILVQPGSSRASSAPPVSGTPLVASGKSVPVVTVPTLELNDVRQGALETVSLSVHIVSGVLDVDVDESWLTVDPEVADSLTREIEVTVDTSALRLGRKRRDVAHRPDSLPGYGWWFLVWLTFAHAYYFVPASQVHQGQVFVGQESVDVLVEVAPRPAQVRAGWLFTGLVVAGELTGLAWIVWMLVVGV